MKHSRLFLILGLILASARSSWGEPPLPLHPVPKDDFHYGETKEHRDARMAWWREAKFGMFVHWGIYSIPAKGEWYMHNSKIPVAEYAKYAAQFNPTQFDAEKWVQTAQDAGMKYMVVTAKHHDGFAMFPTKVGGFNIIDNSPFKRDPLKELAAACRKHGIKLGFYYSQSQDWHQPGGASVGGHWDKAQDGDFTAYVKNVAVPQVKELLTNYGPDIPAVLWWDTGWAIGGAQAALFQPVLAQRPDLITNARLGGGHSGDYMVAEQNIPPGNVGDQDFESCMTINHSWAYTADDHKFASTEDLIHNLIDIVSKGGNYLLNVGPDATGVIPQPEVDRLKAMGYWLKVNGEAIYGTGPTAFGAEDGAYDPVKKDGKGRPIFKPAWDWRCTTKPGKLFIHIFKWPSTGKFDLAGVKDTVTSAYFLADPQHTPLAFTQKASDVTVTLPAAALDPIATVLCLQIKK